MSNTPTLNKPFTHAVVKNEDDGFKQNYKNRNLRKMQTHEFEDEGIDKAEIKIDFYKLPGKNNNQEPPVSSNAQIDNNDFNLGQNTKMVIDFTNELPPEESKQHSKR